MKTLEDGYIIERLVRSSFLP